MAADLETLLTEQLITQREVYGLDPSQDLLPSVRMRYIRDNALAVTHEVHEALNETAWKLWMNNDEWNQHAYLDELVDVLNFLLNLMLATGLPPADLAFAVERRFYEKKILNLQRHGVQREV